MSVLALGLNHHSAPLDLRGRFAVPGEHLAPTLQRLRDHLLARGAPSAGLALLSTCNRTELYLGSDDHALLPALDEWLAGEGGTSPAEWRAHRYARSGSDGARHAFRVAAGLDSAVLGEPQILGQLKSAVRTADEAGQLDTTLQQLFQRSFAVAKAVRSHTELGQHAVTLAAAAVHQAQALFGRLDALNVLFVGAGEMIERMATHFAGRGLGGLAVANRSPERAQALADRLGGRALPLRGLDDTLHDFDIVISCTASTLPLIGLGAVQRALKKRRHRPMLMVDLAVPRDIEAEVQQLPDVYLYTVDDLAQRATEGGLRRQAAVQQAEALVDDGVQQFQHWLAHRHDRPLVQAVLAHGEACGEAALRRARKALLNGAPAETVLAELADLLTRKLLHPTLAGLQHSRGEAHGEWVRAAERCFAARGLDPDQRP